MLRIGERLRGLFGERDREAIERYSESSWFKEVLATHDRFKRRFLFAALYISLLVPIAFIITDSIESRYTNLPTNIVSLGIIAALLVLLADERRTALVSTIALAVYPLLYGASVLIPDTHGIYALILLTSPLLLGMLSDSVRGSARWALYYVGLLGAVSILPAIGVPNNWSSRFRPEGIAIIYSSAALIGFMSFLGARNQRGMLRDSVEKLTFDKVTGLPTIRVFHQDFSEGTRSIVGILRAGNYKELSTLFGYDFTEEILQRTARKLREALAGVGARAYRLHGHDFGILLPYPSGTAEEAQELALGIARAIDGNIIWHDKEIEPVYSIGYAIAEGIDGSQALGEADLALKRCLEEHGEVLRFDPSMDDRSDTEAMIDNLVVLSRNIREGKLKAFHQAIVNLDDGKPVWCESLLRVWNYKEDYESPSAYLKVSRSTGFDDDISDFMIAHAEGFFQAKREWLSINVNARDIARPAFAKRAVAIARLAAEAGSKFILELLESDLMDSKGAIDAPLREFRDSGGLVAIDDFGSGYSNFRKFLSMPIDIVKFDGEFVRLSYENDTARSLLRKVAQCFNEAGMITVAEFVETEEQAAMLKEMGIAYGQGYYWSKPASPA